MTVHVSKSVTVHEVSNNEKEAAAKTIYNVLGWNEKYFDVINSFYWTYCCGLACTCNATCEELGIEGESWKKDPFSIDDKDFEFKVFCKPYGTKVPGYYLMKKTTLANKVIDNKTIYCKASKIMVNTQIKEYNYLASLCHCIANFMPCPDNQFNSAKGLIKDVKDYLPLMINKIQKCVDEENKLTDGKDEPKITIDLNTVKKWKTWFVINREKYCLEPYYYIEQNEKDEYKIVGIPFFKNQSLEYPYPKSKEELKECLEEIIKRIQCRAKLMVIQYNKQ